MKLKYDNKYCYIYIVFLYKDRNNMKYDEDVRNTLNKIKFS